MSAWAASFLGLLGIVEQWCRSCIHLGSTRFSAAEPPRLPVSRAVRRTVSETSPCSNNRGCRQGGRHAARCSEAHWDVRSTGRRDQVCTIVVHPTCGQADRDTQSCVSCTPSSNAQAFGDVRPDIVGHVSCPSQVVSSRIIRFGPRPLTRHRQAAMPGNAPRTSYWQAEKSSWTGRRVPTGLVART